jgi:hypothetical protein
MRSKWIISTIDCDKMLARHDEGQSHCNRTAIDMHLSGKEINSLWNTNNLFAVAKKLGAKDVNKRDHIIMLFGI